MIIGQVSGELAAGLAVRPRRDVGRPFGGGEVAAGDAACMRSTSRHYPSLVGHGVADWIPETRVSWLAGLNSADVEPVFTDVAGRTCAVTVDAGPGCAIVATTDLPSHPALFTALLSRLGCSPGLRLRTSVPGVVVTTGVTPRGERMLHVLNPTGYAATVQVDVHDPTGLLTSPWPFPPVPVGCSVSDSNCRAAGRSCRATPRSPSWRNPK